MRMGYGLDLEQTQKLIITPELRQAITILQLSSLELETYVEQQLQENPLLEICEDKSENNGIINEESKSAENKSNEESIEEGNIEDSSSLDINWEEYFQDSSDLGISVQKNREPMEYEYENFLSRSPSLAEHLLFQLFLSKCKGIERRIGEYLIGNIDHNGYLKTTVEEAAGRFGVSAAEVENVLRVIQSFEPSGVGARNLEECLLIQLDALGLADATLTNLVKRHLKDLGSGRLNKIAKEMDLAVKEVQKAADILRQLDPKPGRNFAGSDEVRYVVPDVVLEKVDGEYVILINDTVVPRLTINRTYRSVLSQESLFDKNTRRYVESKLNAATWLIRSIEQRRITLYKIASCLVELQRDFLDYGIKYLKPLNLKKVAGMVGMHESTVSRATANKYMETPQGIFEMKYFFSNGLTSVSGRASSISVKKMIQEIINGEDPGKPLNDKKVAQILLQRGIKISRRTVAKYRDELGIPAANKRRRY